MLSFFVPMVFCPLDFPLKLWYNYIREKEREEIEMKFLIKLIVFIGLMRLISWMEPCEGSVYIGFILVGLGFSLYYDFVKFISKPWSKSEFHWYTHPEDFV